MVELLPLRRDVEAAVVFLHEAMRAYALPLEEYSVRAIRLEEKIRSGEASGALVEEQDRSVGLALWDGSSPVGLSVDILYLADGARTVERYRSLMDAIERSQGPIALAPGQLAGATEAEIAHLMRGCGYARFGRSEMRFSAEHPLPTLLVPPNLALRPVTAADAPALAAVHARAYEGRLDRYLFLVDPDPKSDSERQLADMLGGRWGDFLDWASVVAHVGEIVVGACLVVRASYGPLIADVMVDPVHQGRGVGRAVLVASLAALRAHGETIAVLNVTEGNDAALRVYERVGFVRSLGPSWGWYSQARIPIPEPG